MSVELNNQSELMGPDEAGVHPDVQAEILRRRDEADAHPELLEPWAATTERLRARLHAQRKQTG